MRGCTDIILISIVLIIINLNRYTDILNILLNIVILSPSRVRYE